MNVTSQKKVFKRPVFVTDYPKEIKAFYMKLNPDGKDRSSNGLPRARYRRNHRRQPERGRL